MTRGGAGAACGAAPGADGAGRRVRTRCCGRSRLRASRGPAVHEGGCSAEKCGLRLSLPATSANLGPGFDAAGLALSLHLTVEAHAAPAVPDRMRPGAMRTLCGELEAI